MKMSDVFELPVCVPVETDDELHYENDHQIMMLAEFASRRMALSAAHAINCHDELVDALSKALSEIEAQTCYHEDTYRGGAIWTICRDCGSKWADDEGGFQKPKENKRVSMLRHVLTRAKGEE